MEGQHGFVPPVGGSWGPPPIRKRLIICCDGTWQASNHGTHSIPSNVAKISRAVAKTYVNESNQKAPQVVYYDAGVATADWLDGKIAGYFGAGLDENVCEAYNFLANNYNPCDEVFFFGFSRGAYTVRATASLVAEVGICQDIQMSRFWEMYTVYKAKDPATPLDKTPWGALNLKVADKAEKDLTDDDMITLSKGDENMAPKRVRKGDGYMWLSHCNKPVDIKVVGVFDTVGAMGIPENRFVDVTKWNKPYEFWNTDIHPDIENAFQALALDEQRKPFSPTLWNMPSTNTRTKLIQCWFPGVHVNIGGGSDDGLKKAPKGDLECMANTTFAWMVDRCRPFLHFEEKVLNFVVAQYFDALAKLTARADKTEEIGWGVGPIQRKFTGVTNMIGGLETRTPGHYPNKPDTREYIHPVVFHGMDKQKYVSNALSGFERVSNGDGLGYSWVKTYTPEDVQSWTEWAGSMFNRRTVKKDKDSVTVTVPEFVIPRMVVQQGSANNESYYASPLERLLILRDQWTDSQMKQAFESDEQFTQRKSSVIQKQGSSQYLMQLDRDNRLTKFIGEDAKWGTPVKTSTEKMDNSGFQPQPQ